MSPSAGRMLLEQIVPIIMGVFRKGRIKTTGSEDKEELAADAIAQAAKIVDSAEQAGKVVSPNSVAHYALQAVKSGRRSTSGNRTDVMGAAAQLDGLVAIQSIDAPVTFGDGNEDEHSTLHDLLASGSEDPSQSAIRRLSWNGVLAGLNDRQGATVQMVAEGRGGYEIAETLHVTPARITQIKREVADRITEGWGEDVVADVGRAPAWRAHVRANRHERM